MTEPANPHQSQRDLPVAAPKVAVSYHAIDTLKPDLGNPRRHSSKQVQHIADSIKAFGFNVPILIDNDLKVIAGHGRLLACRKLGWTEVPTISIGHLTKAQARAVLDLDFSLEATGFDMAEIDLRITALDAAPDPQPDAADALPAASLGPPVSKIGDLWLLGDHRVICADALRVQAYEALLGEERAAMVFTDPPYNVPIEGHVGGLGATHHRPFPMACGEMDRPGFAAFLTRACSNLAAFSGDGSLHFVCMDWRHLDELLAAGNTVYGELKNLCVWVKANAGMGSLYRSQHELVLVFKRSGGAHRNNVQLGRFGRNRSNVWQYPGVNSFSRNGEEGNLLALHPTVKPVALVSDAILDCTARRDIVLDGFLGSGTTLIAAERTGRRCRGLELDPGYVDTIIRRWQALTGDAAVHAASGMTFNELACEREVADAA